MSPLRSALLLLLAIIPLAARGADAPRYEFTRDVLPLLEAHCTKCHGPQEQKGGLRLHTAEVIRKGGITEHLIVPGHSDRSYLVQRLRGEGDEDRMPPSKKGMPAADIAVIRAWIDGGAL